MTMDFKVRPPELRNRKRFPTPSTVIAISVIELPFFKARPQTGAEVFEK
jgi:hypothetical protein